MWRHTSRIKEAERRHIHRHGCPSVAVVAEWSQSGRHSHRSKHAIGGREEAQGRQKRRPHWGTELCSRTHILCGDHWPTIVHPFCNHGDAAAPPLPQALPHAFNIGVFKYGKSNPTTIEHIYNESENLNETCDVDFDSNNWLNRP